MDGIERVTRGDDRLAGTNERLKYGRERGNANEGTTHNMSERGMNNWRELSMDWLERTIDRTSESIERVNDRQTRGDEHK